MKIKSIGNVIETEKGMALQLNEELKSGLLGLGEYSHVQVIWWVSETEGNEYLDGLVLQKPYVKGPEKIGVFATRSQFRPNSLALSTITIAGVDLEKGIIYTYFIDAYPGTPILDIKPYLPATDISGSVSTPQWCRHWPTNIEESGSFNWEGEFTFSS